MRREKESGEENMRNEWSRRSVWVTLVAAFVAVSTVYAGEPRVRLKTSEGDIVLALDAEKAPALWLRVAEKYGDASGVNNFLFGSHSQSKDRARNMEAELARNYEGNDTPSHH